MNNIPTAEEFLKSKGLFNDTSMRLQNIGLTSSEAMIEFAKLHVEAQAKEIVDKCLINREPTGKDKTSGSCSDKSFEGDLGYEDYIPVNYTINEESILNAYPLTNIK